MVIAESNRKSVRFRNPTALPPRRIAGRHNQKTDPLHTELFHLIRKLQLTLAVVSAAVKALHAQAAEQDEDIALVLQRHVGDALALEIDKWDALLRALGGTSPPAKH